MISSLQNNRQSALLWPSVSPMRRRGFSLMEIAAVATLSTMLLSVAVTLFLTLDKHDRQSGLQQRHAANLTRLADQFRADVHVAREVTGRQADQPAGILFTCSLPNGSQIEYQQIKQHVIRTLTDAKQTQRQERFLSSPQATFELVLPVPLAAEGEPPAPIEQESAGLVRLIMRGPLGGKRDDAMRQLTLVAQVGRDLPVTLAKGGSTNVAP